MQMKYDKQPEKEDAAHQTIVKRKEGMKRNKYMKVYIISNNKCSRGVTEQQMFSIDILHTYLREST